MKVREMELKDAMRLIANTGQERRLFSIQLKNLKKDLDSEPLRKVLNMHIERLNTDLSLILEI